MNVFNSRSWSIILKQLQNTKIKPELGNIIVSYWSLRLIALEAKYLSTSISISTGVS